MSERQVLLIGGPYDGQTIAWGAGNRYEVIGMGWYLLDVNLKEAKWTSSEDTE